MFSLTIGEENMTEEKATVVEAGAQATAQAVPGNTSQKKGDYTKYFYRQIENLWYAVEQLQKENDALQAKMKNASVVFNGGE